MQINPTTHMAPHAAPDAPKPPTTQGNDNAELREAFGQFVGEVFFGQMLKAMRKAQRKPAYFHGGRAEEMFQQQLDQVLAKRLGQASADSFVGPMYDLFCANMQRR